MNAPRPSDRQAAAAPPAASRAARDCDRVRDGDSARANGAREDTDWHQEEFLATLAHELRNPLAPIRSAVEIMRMAEGDEATTSAARAIIERQVDRLVRLIDDLVDVARLMRGKLELKTERADLAAIVRTAVEINRPLLESKQQHLSLRLAREPLPVEADKARLAQVFANLVENGAKYSDASTEICVEAVRDGDHGVVTVTDHGMGIPADRLERVFDLFSQDDRLEPSPHSSLGVGLTLVKRLVDLHGGTVTARSAGLGTGSSFSVRLALLPVAQGEPTAFPSAAGLARGAPRARILVADDNYDAAQSLALMLGMDGHDVRTAGDGLEALRIAEDFRPQFVLLDIGMPKLDGYETARRLRERPWARGTRLYALTGWGQEEDRERARRAGFDRHLVKPVDPDTLTQLLDQTPASARE